ncbi:MAG TPA: YraN family protein [Gemmatimonadales bacterium]|nr:YraN family protein [Gemmatimonadales bacterium]
MRRASPLDSPDPRQRRGYRGELAARRWLEARGWVVEAHRYRVGREEIDLVLRRESLVAFVEVKTRRSLAHGHPREAVHWRKRRAIARVAAVWALRFGRWGDSYRFDVVEVFDRAGEAPEVHHVADAWRLER